MRWSWASLGRCVVVVLVLLRCCCAQERSLSATTVYMSTTGTDDVHCGSQQTPCASLRYIVDQNANTTSGQLLIYVAPGVYTAKNNVNVIEPSKDVHIGTERSEDVAVFDLSDNDSGARMLEVSNGGSIALHGLWVRNAPAGSLAEPLIVAHGGVSVQECLFENIATSVLLLYNFDDALLEPFDITRTSFVNIATRAVVLTGSSVGTTSLPMSLTSCTFKECKEGALGVAGQVQLLMDNVTITGDMHNNNDECVRIDVAAKDGSVVINNGVYSQCMRAFRVQSASAEVSFNGVTFLNNGNSFSEAGSAVYVTSATPVAQKISFERCSFTDNAAQTSGGALYLAIKGETALPLISQCTFSGNSAASGGAVWSNAGLSVSGSTFVGNACRVGAPGGAGGAVAASGVVEVEGTRFGGNSCAGGTGGALFLYNGTGTAHATTASIRGFDMQDNDAQSGGAVAVENALSLTLQSGTFTANSGEYGNDLWCRGGVDVAQEGRIQYADEGSGHRTHGCDECTIVSDTLCSSSHRSHTVAITLGVIIPIAVICGVCAVYYLYLKNGKVIPSVLPRSAHYDEL